MLLGGALRVPPALEPDRFQSRDEQGYVSVAIALAETGRYGRESLHWPPGAPVAFAAAAELGHERMDIAAAYWVQWAAGTALIGLVFALAAALGGPVAGLVAALLVATYPPLIAATGDLLSEPLGRSG